MYVDTLNYILLSARFDRSVKVEYGGVNANLDSRYVLQNV